MCEKGECGSFFGLCPKNEPHILPLCEQSERKGVCLKVAFI
ncbi:MAG: hypothetical protein U5L45_19670 [Saprospiraceae bacterium]|nr:hypothetical protein [Saprospiraceae bacterium]